MCGRLGACVDERLNFHPFFPFKMTSVRRTSSIPFPESAASAFGQRRSRNASSAFDDGAQSAFGGRRQGPPAAASAGRANFSDDANAAFSSRGGQKRNEFDENASSVFGRSRGSQGGFDTNAASAFGRKGGRRLEYGPPPVSALEALRKKATDEAAAAQKVKDADFTNQESWPELGLAAKAAPASKMVSAEPKVSFAELMRKRKEEEEAVAAAKAEEQDRMRLAREEAERDRMFAPRIFGMRSSLRYSEAPVYHEDEYEHGRDEGFDEDSYAGDGSDHDDNLSDEEDQGQGEHSEHNAHLFRGY